jgi:hypothetical protein
MRMMLVVGFFVALISGIVMAAEEEKPVADDWLSDFRNPCPGLEMGLDFRFRTIVARNITTLDSDATGNKYNYQRYRSRWWTKWMLSDDVDLNTRMVWEFRTWDEPASKPQHTDFDEILFDRLNVTMRNMFDQPLTGVIGRQDLILGVGWLVLDGTPLDGSRTIFTDAARFTYEFEGKKTKLDMIYIDNAAASDRWLKPINDRDRALTEQDEYGAILYLTNQATEKSKLEAYFMYKNDNPVDVLPGDRNFPGLWSRKAEIFTFGGAVSQTLNENWNYRVEGAIQTGNKSDATADLSTGTMQDMEAYGALTNLEYLFKDSLDSSAHVGYEYCSGDDPGTNDNEQFDPLWAEWPRWSELYIYTYSRETMIAESTNLHRINIGHKFRPNKQWQICTDYHLLWADENTNQTSSFISPSNKFRGQLITCWAKYKFSPKLFGHLLGEYLIPGNYYEKDFRDDAFFLRFNLEYTF